jgi:hypothetical protein
MMLRFDESSAAGIGGMGTTWAVMRERSEKRSFIFV